jgi:hypothetical protein
MPRVTNNGQQSLYHHLRMLISSAALGALVCASATSAFAEDATINSMSLETQTAMGKNIVYVQASTGGKWDTILPGQIEFWAGMQVDTKYPGYVETAGIFLGTCVDRQCGESGAPLLYIESVGRRDYGNAKNISFSTSKLRVSGILPAPTPYGDEILRLCNKELTDGKATRPHGFDMPMVVAFTVNTRKGSASNVSEVADPETSTWGGGDETRHGQIWARVECLATSQQTVDPSPDPHRTKTNVSELDLFLATVAAPDPSPRTPAGAQCKPIVVTTRITTDKAGPVTVKQWRQVNGGPVTSETKQMVAAAKGGGKFGDDWVKLEQFTKTTTVQYKDEVVGGTFAPSTPWKSITVHCNGNYAPPTSDANPDNRMPPPRGGANEAEKRRKAAEKAREDARLREDAQLRDERVMRPFGGRMVALPPPGPRPGFGMVRPMNPYGNAGFGHRRVFVR